MCQAVLSPNLTKIFQWKVSQIADNRLPVVMLLGGLSVNLNHLKTALHEANWLSCCLCESESFIIISVFWVSMSLTAQNLSK